MATKLRVKAFCFLCYLALRRTDGRTDGWVSLDEILERIPRWRGLSPAQAGKHIHLFQGRYAWFGNVQWEEITQGPYRLRSEATFRPSRDAANLFLASMSHDQQRRRRRLTDTELEAFDLLVQYGMYAPAIVDLILQRLGDPDRLTDPRERLAAYRILVTLAKNRGQTGRARGLAKKGLRLAHRLGRENDIAYLLDQLACASHIACQYDNALKYFHQEIEFLNDLGEPRATAQLVHAYRGIAMTLWTIGEIEGARDAIHQSQRCAEESGNSDGVRLARLVEARLDGISTNLELADVLRELPFDDRVGQLLFLNQIAERFFEHGNRSAGEELLRQAHADATRLDITHVVERSRALAERYGVELDRGPHTT